MHLPQGAAALVDAGGENGALVHALTARAGVLLRGAAKELLIVAAGVALGRIATGPATDGVATCTFALDANAAVYAATRTVAEAPISTEGAPDAGLSTTKVITLSVGDFLWLAATSMAAVEAQFVAPKADAAAKGDGAKQSLTDPKVARALANVPIDVDVSGTNAAAEAAVLKRGAAAGRRGGAAAPGRGAGAGPGNGAGPGAGRGPTLGPIAAPAPAAPGRREGSQRGTSRS